MLKFARVISANTDLLSAQAFIFTREDSLDQKSAHLALLIAAEGEDVFTKVRQTCLSVEDKFFDSELPVPQRFSLILDFLLAEFKELKSLQILLTFIQENALSVQALGNPEAYLLRDGELSLLVSKEQDGQLISGFIKEEDQILLITAPFPEENEEQSAIKEWNKDQIQKLTSVLTSELEEGVEQFIKQSQYQDPIATILFVSEVEVESNQPSEISPQIKPIEEHEQTRSPEQNLSEKVDQEKVIDIPNLNEQQQQQGNKESEDQTTDAEPLYRSPFRDNANSLNQAAISRSMYFKSALVNKKLRLILLIGVVILIPLLIGLFFFNQNKSTQNKLFEEKIILAKDRYTKAQSLKDTDTEQATVNLMEAKNNLDDALKIKPKDNDALNLKNEIDQNSNQILKLNEITDWPVFLSLDLIKSGFTSKKMSYSLGNILMLDENQKTLVTVDLEKKSNQILAGNVQLGNALFASLNGVNAFSYSGDKGVVSIDIKSQKAKEIIKPDPEWGDISDIFGFGSNVYLLDRGKNQIWKYVPTAASYADKATYLKGENNDLSGAEKLAIDFSVWVLKDGPEIIRFTAGSPDNFSVGGLDKPIASIESFFVSEEEDKIYILDSLNSRVVILKKSGQYLSQISGEKFKTATDLVVDDTQKKLYLLEGAKIYQIPL